MGRISKAELFAHHPNEKLANFVPTQLADLLNDEEAAKAPEIRLKVGRNGHTRLECRVASKY